MFGMEFGPPNLGYDNTTDDDRRRALYMALLSSGGAMTAAAFSKNPGEGLATGPSEFMKTYMGAMSDADKRRKNNELFNIQKQQEQTNLEKSQFDLSEKKDTKAEQDNAKDMIQRHIAAVSDAAVADGVPKEIVAQAALLAGTGNYENAQQGLKMLQDAIQSVGKDWNTSKTAAEIAAGTAKIQAGQAPDYKKQQQIEQQRLGLDSQRLGIEKQRYEMEKQNQVDAKTDTRVDNFVKQNMGSVDAEIQRTFGKNPSTAIMGLQQSDPKTFGGISPLDTETAATLLRSKLYKERFGTADPLEARDVLATKARLAMTGKNTQAELTKLMPQLKQTNPDLYTKVQAMIQTGRANFDFLYKKVADELQMGGQGY